MPSIFASRLTLLGLVLLSFALSARSSFAALEATRLRCESLENPLGIDTLKPQLSWALTSPARAQSQTAYQILVASTPEALAKDTGDLWDSGKVASPETLYIPYAGKPLRSGLRAFWKVRSWDQSGAPSAWSAPATFEMGLLRAADWQAKWIGQTPDIDAKPAPLLRKEFPIAGEIKRARAYVCGLGYYELRINGQKVGDHVLDPGFTRFDKRTLYTTYDVTKALQTGKNAIGVILGNGWYNEQSLAVWKFDKAPWRAAPELLLRLEIETADGRTQTLLSDTTWKASTGPITFNNIYSGENYDARLEQKGWDAPGFNDSAWEAALEMPAPKGKMVAQMMPPIRVTKTLPAVKVTEPKPGVFIYDFGQNFSGFPRLKISGPAGATITMKCAERLHADGTLDQSAIAKYMLHKPPQIFQTNNYTLKGDGIETWQPRFTYQGFQYVEVTGAPGKLGPENLEGLFIHTDVPLAGEFTCSNPLLNKILETARWAYLSNLQSIPTDCPQREKNGWTGDAQLASEQGLFNYDGVAVYRKWINDVADNQEPNRRLSVIIPDSGWGMSIFSYAPAWDAAFFEIPWNVYLYTGDRQMLEQHFDGFVMYLDWVAKQAKDNIIKGDLGDWCRYKADTPVDLTSTAYYYRDANIASKAAGLLGKKTEEKKYAELAERIRKAFNKTFFNAKTGLYANGTQTAQSAALYFNIAEPKDRPAIFKNLLANVASSDNHIDAGILGSKYLLNVLTADGRTDVAYLIAGQKTMPSWGWWIEQGATTMWEQWDGNESRNHIMFGEIAAWFYKALAGINPDPARPGFKHVIIQPNPVAGLTSASAWHESAYGRIESNWKQEGGAFTLDVTIPANTTATVHLPATKTQAILEGGKTPGPGIVLKQRTGEQAVVEVGSGHYAFVVR